MQAPTILYVEDNAENRLLVRRVLMAEGFTILEAESATKAMQILQAHTPELILVDINLPGVDGYTLTARLRANEALRDTPIVALTANVMHGDRQRSLDAGCDGYIQKPVDIDRFPHQVRDFIRK